MLTITDHRRDRLGLNYVYPVISRRAGGLSIGINLNTNNACNWRCIYCQVPGLHRNAAPVVDLNLLEQELCDFLADALRSDFCTCYNISPEYRSIQDIAISGNGESTMSIMFDQVVELVGYITRKFGLLGNIKLVLITNGSLIGRPVVRKGIARLSELNGEVWFKLDSATNAGIRRINNAHISKKTIRRNLEIASGLCPTWLQTCVFGLDGKPPSEAEQKAYIQFLSSVLAQGTILKGVMLYGIARPSKQPEAPRLSRLPAEWLEQYAQKISETGINVKTSV
ncbi:MAG: radical SAM protein [Gammaproteobacteria bacterium]|nr:radical SAM protein [Gammaproteobacteria bacterium]